MILILHLVYNTERVNLGDIFVLRFKKMQNGSL